MLEKVSCGPEWTAMESKAASAEGWREERDQLKIIVEHQAAEMLSLRKQLQALQESNLDLSLSREEMIGKLQSAEEREQRLQTVVVALRQSLRAREEEDSSAQSLEVAALREQWTACQSELAASMKHCHMLARQLESCKETARLNAVETARLSRQLDESIAAMRQQQVAIAEAHSREHEHQLQRRRFKEDLSLAMARIRQLEGHIQQLVAALRQAQTTVQTQQEEMDVLHKHVAEVLADSLTPGKKAAANVREYRVRRNGEVDGDTSAKKLFDVFPRDDEGQLLNEDSLEQASTLTSGSAPLIEPLLRNSELWSSVNKDGEKWQWLENLIEKSQELHETIAFAFVHAKKTSPAQSISSSIHSAAAASSASASSAAAASSALMVELSQRHHNLHEAIVNAPWVRSSSANPTSSSSTTRRPSAEGGAYIDIPDISPARDLSRIAEEWRGNKTSLRQHNRPAPAGDLFPPVAVANEGAFTHIQGAVNLLNASTAAMLAEASDSVRISHEAIGMNSLQNQSRNGSENLLEQSFESALSDIWNISTDNDEEGEIDNPWQQSAFAPPPPEVEVDRQHDTSILSTHNLFL